MPPDLICTLCVFALAQGTPPRVFAFPFLCYYTARMALDFLLLGSQIREMGGALRDELVALPRRVARLREQLLAEAPEWEYWRDVVEEQSATAAWLAAKPLERWDTVYELPPCPPSYVVAASDGSQIDVDHHGIAACWVLNIGLATIRYGPDAAYHASSRPTLGYGDGDMYLRDPHSGREWPLEGQLLAAQRDVYEGLQLRVAAAELPGDRPRLALQDGTLIRWSLAGFDPFVRDRLLGDYLTYLDEMYGLDCPVASYLSRPRARDVVGLARLLMVSGDYNRWREQYPERAGDPARNLVDAILFEQLEDGQRTARWGTMSRITVEHYGPEQRIQFFYLRVGSELARVEFPAWVAERGYLPLVHTLVYDQCARGLGYPNVLARAHELAVIHAAERREFEALIERLLARDGVDVARSHKADAKRGVRG